MARERFDRERAYAALRRYAKTSGGPDPELAKIDLDLAYTAVDEVVEITLRNLFSRAPNRTNFDDLRQAARLRLYQTLPKLATLCDNSEYYFRLCCSVSKRAMLTEYARLRKQSARELSAITTEQGLSLDNLDYRLGNIPEENENQFPIEDEAFDDAEDTLLIDQLFVLACDQARTYLITRINNPNERNAAVAVLLKFVEGREISPMYLSRVYGIANSNRAHNFVVWALRKAAYEAETYA